MEELLILVDENDKELGEMEKLSMHQQGLLHRAFSIFVFNSKGEFLIQQRADEKYHSAGLWSNTCCSHPRKGESTVYGCNRRLEEEMGLKCDLEFKFSFTYKIQLEDGLTEHEFDHVYFGISDESPILNVNEVKAWKYISLNNLKQQIEMFPQLYSAWLKICLPKVIEHFDKKLEV